MILNSQGSSWRPMATEAFAMLGAPSLAYVRPLEIEGEMAYGIFAANGQPLGAARTIEDAFAAAVEHDLKPVNVH